MLMNIPLFWMGSLHDQNDFPGQSRNIDTKTVTKRLVGGQNQWLRVLNTIVLFLGVFYPSQRSSTSLDLSHLNQCFLILLPLILFMLKIYYGYAIVQVYLLKPVSKLVYIYLYLFGNYRRKNLTQIFLTETTEHFLQLLVLHRLPKTHKTLPGLLPITILSPLTHGTCFTLVGPLSFRQKEENP